MADARDYYADLELPVTADVQEIKRQFRKLALKYHPDRNPGREVEVNSQFQIIQSAHEVLTDPQQKAKYDATLGRSSRFPAASGVKGNPWQNVGQQFQPPPRRNTAARNATSGAQRWQSRFSNGVPPTAKQQAPSDAEAKKNAARAFENMRKSQAQASDKNTQQQARPSQPPPPPPRTESARQRAQAAFGFRKAGFHPHSSMPGDEPPVTGQNYYPQRTGAEQPRAPSPPPRKPRPTAMPDPLNQFKSRASFADSRQRSPYSSHGGEKTDPFDGIPSGRSKSTGEPHRPEDSSTSDEGVYQEQKYGNSSTRKYATPRESRTGRGTSGENNNGPPPNAEKQPNPDERGGSAPSIFNFSPGDDAFEPTSPVPDFGRSAKSSVDDINTRFVNDDVSSTWQFSAGNGEQADQTTSRPPSGSRANHRSPLKRQTARETGHTDHQPQTEPSSGFNPDGWSDKFSSQTFVPQPAPSASSSPTRPSRANSKKVRVRPTVGTAAIVPENSSDDETYEWRGRNSQAKPASVDSPQAMDIDSPTFATAASPAEPSSVRNIPVEPSRPEWRPGNVDSMAGEAKPERPEKVPINPNAVGSEDSEDFKANFAELKNVAPFAQQGSGLKSLADLQDNLPFESRASEELPIKLPKVHPLIFPAPPEAPLLPPTVAIEGMRPNAASWAQYLAEFGSYLERWDEFNGQVVDHFATRKAHVSRTRSSKGYAFLGARSDGDVCEYFNWVQQDNDVRQRWNACCDQHEKRLREFMVFREKMK
ncbi:hypothetical protein G6O67_000745 [Ophiocordyceps sinensis]|uniref:J domain-containing protein n=1 Tax=Ophiocordyceps sinensis TaxID=72228 RepID=A0A8H4Q066_9HYPO|nr:hypothetical protein G6O67_000745 [Ophiocordyceps sinensis]